jgi:D-beta-D-heptose 7-phosphate kinase/D-beta-D-heptose 1-phosphate adenosyltransferase
VKRRAPIAVTADDLQRLRTGGTPRLLVLGDFMLDRYVWGDVTRISPEAPVQVLRVTREESRLGGAANVVRNLVALGARVLAAGTVGQDAAGAQIRSLLSAEGVPTRGLVTRRQMATTEKTRMIAHAQQVLRIDREQADGLDDEAERKLRAFVVRSLPSVDGVILSDYGKGVLTPRLTAAVIRAARDAGKFVLVDPKGRDFSKYRGATALTPNRSEAQEGSGLALGSSRDVATAARRLKRLLDLDTMFITLGADGIALVDEQGRFFTIPAESRDVYDVTGAGDTVLATLALAMALGFNVRTGAALANAAAGVVVRRLGSATTTREEIASALEGGAHQGKVVSLDRVADVVADARAGGRRVVFTNGCFDLLHVGHVSLLARAKREGDLLVVGINSDRSVRALKGRGRPVVGEGERAAVLAALASVDVVTVFDDLTPENVIRKVRPDVLIKGADWRGKGVVGQAFVESYGGRVALLDLVQGHSTSDLVARAQRSALPGVTP